MWGPPSGGPFSSGAFLAACSWMRIRAGMIASIALVALACGGVKNDTGPSPVPGGSGGGTPSPGGSSSGVQLTDDFGGRQLFPSDNWWNQDISTAPIDPQSDAYISYIGRTRTSHPDFGPPPYGIPYVGVGGSEPRTAVSF